MEKKGTLYLETTIISYLTARPSGNVIVAARQKLTGEWWITERERYDLFVSALVLEEIQEGDRNAAQRRLKEIEKIRALELDNRTLFLAQLLIESKMIPERYSEDAVHVAVCAANNIDYLMTWNCKHLANATIRRQMDKIIEQAGFRCPVICTPDELMEL